MSATLDNSRMKTNLVTFTSSSPEFKIGKFRILINARYVVTKSIDVILESGEEYTIDPHTTKMMTVDRIEKDGNEVVLRWVRLDTLKPVELRLTKDYNKLYLFKNFAY
jgi:hypothetical protein